jgi:hypothetical protein
MDNGLAPQGGYFLNDTGGNLFQGFRGVKDEFNLFHGKAFHVQEIFLIESHECSKKKPPYLDW